MEGITEGVIGSEAYITQGTGHSAIFHHETNECNNADFVLSSTGHGAFLTSMANECKNADFASSTGHSAFSEGTGDPMDGIVASQDYCETSERQVRGFQPYTWPNKENMYLVWNTCPDRYLENLYLLGMAWVQKVQHIARLTLNSPTGPVWPTEVEPMALKLFEFLRSWPAEHWETIPQRADFLDEINFVWRENPHWLPADHLTFIPLWEYVTGMARTWGWNWHNEVRKTGAPRHVWRQQDKVPRSRFYQNPSSKLEHFHILAEQRVPSVAQYIRTNKFYRVGDDETSCKRPDSSYRCKFKCHHIEDAHARIRLKKKHGLIGKVRAPPPAPDPDLDIIE